MHLSLVVFQAVALILVQGNPFNLRPRISGGEEATPHEFPFIVRLENEYSNGKGYICGGSILTTTKILTAAHCAKPFDKYGASLVKTTIIAGAHDLDNQDQNVQTRVAKVLTQHQSYGTAGKAYDIAVLELDSPLTFNRYVKPICLASGSKTYVGNLAIIMGWGLTDDGSTSQILRKVTLEVLDETECYHDTTKTICTSDPDGGIKSTCGGDSGGPLVVREGGSYKQIGLVSVGRGDCGSDGKETIYTRVTAYRSWIQKQAGSQLTC